MTDYTELKYCSSSLKYSDDVNANQLSKLFKKKKTTYLQKLTFISPQLRQYLFS